MGQQDWAVTFSLGAVTVRQVCGSVDVLMGQVDEVMYTVKRHGKDNRVLALLPATTGRGAASKYEPSQTRAPAEPAALLGVHHAFAASLSGGGFRPLCTAGIRTTPLHRDLTPPRYVRYPMNRPNSMRP